MFARSIACRQGDGRTSSADTSTSWRRPPTTRRFAGLTSAVRDARVPERAHQREPVVDHGVGHFRLVQGLRVLEELRHEHVLGVRGELDDPVHARDAHADVVEQPERVVLVGDEPADRADRRLILELSVQDRPPDPVPAVRARVRGRIDLREHARPVLDRHPDRRGPAGSLEPERLHVRDREAELVAHRPHDRVDAGAADVEVRRGPTPPVGDGERVLGREPSERHLRHDGRQHPAVEHRGRVVGGEVQLDEDDEGDQCVREDAEGDPGAPGRHEHRDDRGERHREGGDRTRGERERPGVRQDRDVRDGQRHRQQVHDEPVRHDDRGEEHHEVPEPLDERQHHDGAQAHREDHRSRRSRRGAPSRHP